MGKSQSHANSKKPDTREYVLSEGMDGRGA